MKEILCTCQSVRNTEYLILYPPSYSDITTTAPPTTPIASTLPMTTFGATTTAPITIPSTTPGSDCEEGHPDCFGETEAPDDYEAVTGKKNKTTFPPLSLYFFHPVVLITFMSTLMVHLLEFEGKLIELKLNCPFLPFPSFLRSYIIKLDVPIFCQSSDFCDTS